MNILHCVKKTVYYIMKTAKVEFINYWRDWPKAFVPFELATFTIKSSNGNRRLFYLIVLNLGICIRLQGNKTETNKNK